MGFGWVVIQSKSNPSTNPSPACIVSTKTLIPHAQPLVAMSTTHTHTQHTIHTYNMIQDCFDEYILIFWVLSQLRHYLFIYCLEWPLHLPSSKISLVFIYWLGLNYSTRQGSLVKCISVSMPDQIKDEGDSGGFDGVDLRQRSMRSGHKDRVTSECFQEERKTHPRQLTVH